VLAQAGRDIVFGSIAERREAVAWAKISNPDFREVCDLCALNPNQAIEKITQLIVPEDAYDPKNKLASSSIRKRQKFLYKEFMQYVHDLSSPDM
jgi:hypothetical protein